MLAGGVGLAGLLDEPEMLESLAGEPVVSEDAERRVVAGRRSWLADAVAGGRLPHADLLAAVAMQCHTTEWAYDEPADEARLLEQLRPDSPSRAAVVAMYRPLPEAAPSDGPRRYEELVHRHRREPALERELAAALPRLTAIGAGVSQRVRAHYEERPYPRWRGIRRPEPRRLGPGLAAALGNPDAARLAPTADPDVLVAGCGTGRHAVLTALRYPSARVLAMDVSLAALGYAARQARDLGVGNVTFAQGDITALGSFDRRFDVVEAVGVLHHLADPEAGWAVLRRLIRPGGLMKVGVYSRAGRAFLDPVRAMLADRGIQPTVAGIRAARRAIKALPPDAPGRMLVRVPDFYSVSGCRDMLFPAHEDRFDLRRVAAALGSLDLEFLGFELPSPRLRRLYLEAFPGEPSGRDLGNWDRLEQANPSLFAAMYRFWARAAP